MTMRKFREAYGHREALAIDPRALTLMFASPTKATTIEDGIAIVSICGPLEHHAGLFFDSYDEIVSRIHCALSDDEVRGVVLCIDSPGGDAAGCTETHRKIVSMREQSGKPIFAYSNEAMFSAAYALGSAADEVWLPQTGGVGSVGVICAVEDRTKANEKAGLRVELLTTGARKADTHSDRPLTDDVLSAIQERIDLLGESFFEIVAESRGMSTGAVSKLEAGVFLGAAGVDAGLADGVAGWDQFIATVKNSVNGALQPTDQSVEVPKEVQRMKTRLQLVKARDEAKAALATAKDQAKAIDALEAAIGELAAFDARYSKKTKTTKVTEVEEDDSDAGAEDDLSSGSSSSSSSDFDSDSSSSATTESAAAELFRVASKLTGKKDPREVLGALEGMGHRVAAADKVEQRLAKVERESLAAKIDAMLDIARRERKVSPGQVEHLRAQGMKDPKWLKGYLASMSPVVRAAEEELAPTETGPAPTPFEGLPAEQKKIIEGFARGAGMSVPDYYAKMQETVKNRAAAAPNGVRS